ncbi:MAG: 16S rRNA processing protein RimM [Actinobacteria bacterium]|nr:16S rRNA processing protein RimM [Actinomycetota bacterium]
MSEPTPEPPEGLLEVGRIGRAHGVRGAVVVTLSSDRVERMAPGSRLHDGSQWLEVVSARSQPNRRWVAHFAGVDDRTEAEALTGRMLSAEPVADDDAFWVHELIGASVVEADGTVRGRCIAVIDNPANDLLELDTGHLVPITFVAAVVDGVITIEPPDGLFDLLD